MQSSHKSQQQRENDAVDRKQHAKRYVLRALLLRQLSIIVREPGRIAEKYRDPESRIDRINRNQHADKSNTQPQPNPSRATKGSTWLRWMWHPRLLALGFEVNQCLCSQYEVQKTSTSLPSLRGLPVPDCQHFTLNALLGGQNRVSPDETPSPEPLCRPRVRQRMGLPATVD